MGATARVEVKGLVRHFGATKAVDGVSFVFGAGQVFGFVGPNGAGKTTTMRIMATLDEPTDGDVFLDGVSVREEPERVRRVVGYVPDTLPSHHDITVHEYLDFFARAYGLKGAALNRAVEGVKEFAGLIDIQDKLLKSLSKGMKQRVSLGRALVHDPQILLMDEPAAGLDPRARIQLRELIVALAEMGKAILISSHILSELAEMCHGVVIIEQGRILETGMLDEILAKTAATQTIAVSTAGALELLLADASMLPCVQDARVSGKELRIVIDDSNEARALLLKSLIERGHQLIEFRRLNADLEDVFMRVTNGRVQ